MDNFIVNTRSSIKITGTKTIYFDPLEIDKAPHDADIIFITHEHYDHFSPDDIQKVLKADTQIVIPKTMLDVVKGGKFPVQVIHGICPYQTDDFGGIKCQGIPAYNINKQFHPKEKNWLGYLIEFDGKTFYAMGDTDVTPEAKQIKADVIFVPIGGKYTMDASEAALYINACKPECVVPIHYGTSDAGDRFIKQLAKDINVRRFW